MFQRHVEDQDGACLDFRHPGRGLGEAHGAVTGDDLVLVFVGETYAHFVLPEFGSPTLQAHYEVQAGMHDRESLNPNVLEDSHDGELTVLVNEGVVAQEG